MTPELIAALCGFAFLAGFVDAVVGGGGLIQVPALLVLLPQYPVATLFGTNKAASIWGTAVATWRYARHIQTPWRSVLPMALAALVAGFAGAAAVSHLDNALLKPVILVVLVVVLAYTLWKKDFGKLHAPKLSTTQQVLVGLIAGTGIGFYDGFLGPGTGSFLVLAFVGLFGFSFLHASASAKAVNVITNFAALAYFLSHGSVLWQFALPMAACNVGGSLLGTRMAIARGAGFVRGMFIVVVGLLILRLGYDVWSTRG
ncbi:hypothetical protein SAMN04488068_0486 [Hydrocarboniphaga daqingensis]|uniref:Probable membrane transporter protein n=1 Tax=Hydrocarboniphaga daqingensis TaxID=490188 RepID=A0A1M5KCQ9_9GAMM|nr:TSUP family transporter [Hydrocarboniphaga daqingensis]SHG50572.1 hypothetical protein SAMN04488068_0486 [Hydrocarboniphaga daqingensis]